MSSAGGCGLGNAAISISCWAKMFRCGRFERQVLGVLGRTSFAARLCSSCLPITSLGRDRPRRFLLPMTALRVTPISRAIWPHESPAWEATLQQFDALRSPGGTIRGHVDGLARRMMDEMSSSEDAAVLQSYS